MSTEHQKYSTENQGEIIRRYAEQRGLTLVRTYEDSGKSGLRIDGRDALKRLIDDVRSGAADFSAILVYDVSRWGRFQDADESAYYEFICKEAGITVHYCAEQFENDGSLSSTIIKSMKRAMAGEYSRELSAKVFTGQCRLIGLGFRQGGMAGYGLRRQLIDEHRQPKGELPIGAQKSLQTDRVILVPGPPDEIETVRRMYRMFVDEGRSERDIADHPERRRRADRPGPSLDSWNCSPSSDQREVHRQQRLQPHLLQAQEEASRQPAGHVDQGRRRVCRRSSIRRLFDAVRQIIQERSRRFTIEEMLERLATLLKHTGWLSGLVIDEHDDMPSTLGVPHPLRQSAARVQDSWATRPAETTNTSKSIGCFERCTPKSWPTRSARSSGSAEPSATDPTTDLLTVNDEFTASIVISRSFQTSAGALRWKIRLDSGLQPDITVALRMDTANRAVVDYYLLPRIDIAAARLRLREENGFSLDAYRFDSLDSFFYLAARTRLRMAA